MADVFVHPDCAHHTTRKRKNLNARENCFPLATFDEQVDERKLRERKRWPTGHPRGRRQQREEERRTQECQKKRRAKLIIQRRRREKRGNERTNERASSKCVVEDPNTIIRRRRRRKSHPDRIVDCLRNVCTSTQSEQTEERDKRRDRLLSQTANDFRAI